MCRCLGCVSPQPAARLELREGQARQAVERLHVALGRVGEDDDGPDIAAARALAGIVMVG